MRHFPRPIERAVRFLDRLLADDTQPRDVRMRCAELLLASYGLVSLSQDRRPRRKTLKGIVDARLDLFAVDKKIAGQVREDRKTQAAKLREELTKL
jgi:hypothetical protein